MDLVSSPLAVARGLILAVWGLAAAVWTWRSAAVAPSESPPGRALRPRLGRGELGDGLLVRLAAPTDTVERGAVALQLLQAGYARPAALATVVALRVVLALVLPLPAVLLAQPRALVNGLLVVLVAASAGYLGPALWVWWRRSERLCGMQRSLPNLLVGCLEAGLGLDAALRRCTRELAPVAPVAPELAHRLDGEVPCCLPFGLPSCPWDVYSDETIMDRELVLSPAGGDNTGWASVDGNLDAAGLVDHLASMQACRDGVRRDRGGERGLRPRPHHCGGGPVRPGDRRGSAAVETALVLPVLIVILFGIIDGSGYLMEWMSVTRAAGQGVRVAKGLSTEPDLIGRATAAAEAHLVAGLGSGPATVQAELRPTADGTVLRVVIDAPFQAPIDRLWTPARGHAKPGLRGAASPGLVVSAEVEPQRCAREERDGGGCGTGADRSHREADHREAGADDDGLRKPGGQLIDGAGRRPRAEASAVAHRGCSLVHGSSRPSGSGTVGAPVRWGQDLRSAAGAVPRGSV